MISVEMRNRLVRVPLNMRKDSSEAFLLNTVVAKDSPLIPRTKTNQTESPQPKRRVTEWAKRNPNMKPTPRLDIKEEI